ncbi:MAG: hypothetical protein MMC23_001285 [Stictis urceolatum]|nr:hypothetical protein [Stictis urceolata]
MSSVPGPNAVSNSGYYHGRLDDPALEPPRGVKPNFVNPYNLNDIAFPVTAIAYAITTILLAVRVYTRLFVMKMWATEDYLCVVGWIAFVIYAAFSLMGFKTGGGTHQYDLTVAQIIPVGYWVNASGPTYCFSAMAIKLSILTQFRNIFFPIKRTNLMFWGTWGLSTLCVVFYLLMALLTIFHCNPRSKAWDPFVDGQCISNGLIQVVTGLFNIVTDLILLLMPQRIIWKLQLPWRRRLTIASVFCVGLLACAASIFRLYFTIRVNSTNDVTFGVGQFGLWITAELTCGLICACVPILPRFAHRLKQPGSLFDGATSLLRRVTTTLGIASRRSGSSGSLSERQGSYALRQYSVLDPPDRKDALRGGSNNTITKTVNIRVDG